MKGVSKTGDYKPVIQKVLGVSLEQLSKDWHSSMKNAYSPLTEVTDVTDKSSRLLFKATKENRLNVSPALSPDGKQIVFLSTRNLFSIDMYLADAKTGEIKTRLIKTAVDPHFESLQFIKSSGSWDAEGKRFVFGAITKGKPVLSIVNVENGKKDKEVVFSQLGEILNPTWSPDGRFIAFSALVGGFSDIFIYDLEEDKLKRMTDDAFADLYPAWSPDGRYIAFVTDRFSTDLSILSIGNYELALRDMKTGDIQKVSGFRNAKNINPQWSPDSKSLYFLSDQNGITNVYRIDLDSQKMFQVTNLYTGVSGIMALSPALSVSQKSERLVYCLYEDEKYNIYSIDSADDLKGREPIAQLAQVNPSVLPPREKGGGEVLGLLKNPLYGLPEETEFEISDYKPKLKLDYVSQPQLAIGVDRYGTFAGGGLAFYFSDMLGYHNLVGMFQLSSRFQDSAALVGYQNSKRRINWGAVAQRIPYVTGGFAAGFDDPFNPTAYIEQEFIFRQINYQFSGFAAYPFNQVRRFELTAGYSLIDFNQEVRTRTFSYPDFIELSREKVEVSPYMGTIDFHTILADYRRYFMPVRPFTLAFRFLHFGRYGKDGEDTRLFPMFIGYETLVRGYNTGSFTVDEVAGTDPFDFGSLFGSKMMVANVELRFPLFQVLGIGRGYYGVFPIDFIAFYDAGLAWWDDNDLYNEFDALVETDRKASFLGGGRKMISSAGVGLRANVFGYLILGVDYVYPFDRPNKGWYFQFTFTPGF